MPARPIIKASRRKGILAKLLLYAARLGSQIFATPRYELIRDEIKGVKILDVGLGMGTLARLMMRGGYMVTGIDVDNTSLYPEIRPVLYDGKKMPFRRKEFDTATIICVLHHCSDQVQVLSEAVRVAKKVIVIEDTYRNRLERIFISLRDQIENWEFYPHEYRSWNEWRALCIDMGWKVKQIRSWSSWDFGILYGRQTLFTVEEGLE